MDNGQIIQKAEQFFKENIPSSRKPESYLAHVEGVRKYALLLAKKYNADAVVVEIAALLHDIGADAGKAHAFKSTEMVYQLLSEWNVEQDLKAKVLSAIKNHSIVQEGESFAEKVALEDQVIRDADGLSFIENSYEGYLQKGIEMYDDITQAKEEALKKIDGMTQKITTAKGQELVSGLIAKAKDFINNY